MKKTIAFSVAMLVFIGLIFVAHTYNSPSESASPQSPQPTPSEPPTEAPTESTETTTEDVKAQMAGFWRLDYPNIYNATIMILSEDGRWESPGHLPTDHVSGGSYVIADEESGIYQLRLTVEQSTSPYSEIGHEFDGYYYDALNDMLSPCLAAEKAIVMWGSYGSIM